MYEPIKRVFDIVVSLIALCTLLPSWLVIAVLIKLRSRGSAFFAQERIGKGGEPFAIIKFRTMRPDADKYAVTAKDDYVDPRVTGFGRFLRNHGLDEMPQLLNVIKGDMSLVGPRPEMQFIVDAYTPLHRRRLSVKPGITGLWQIMGPRDQHIHTNIKYDLYYIRNRGFKLDLWILWKTFAVLFRGYRRRGKS